MVITLWFSSRAKNVLKTSIDLSDQSEIKEKFKANILAKYLVTFFIGLNSGIQKLVPAKIKEISRSSKAVAAKVGKKVLQFIKYIDKEVFHLYTTTKRELYY